MKPITIAAVACICMLPIAGKAQKAELYLNGGVAANGQFFTKYKHNPAEKYPLGIYGDLGIRFTKRSTQLGVGVSMLSLKSTYTYNFAGSVPLATPYVYTNRKTMLPMIYASIGRTVKIKNNRISFGGKLGFVYASTKMHLESPVTGGVVDTREYTYNRTGIGAGVYADYTYYFKRLGIGGGINPGVQYVFMPKYLKSNYIVMSMPVYVGIRYTL